MSKSLWAVALVLAALVWTSPVFADVACGDDSCPGGSMCIDRGNGEQCWQVCRFHSDCASSCCLQIRYPFTAFICGQSSECGILSDGDQPDGDELDGDETSSDGDDGDGDSDAELEQTTPDGPTQCGETQWCTSIERCIDVADNRRECAPVCGRGADCNSDCCVTGFASDSAVCYPEDLECPTALKIAVDPVCASMSPGNILWFVVLLFAFSLRRKSRWESR